MHHCWWRGSCTADAWLGTMPPVAATPGSCTGQLAVVPSGRAGFPCMHAVVHQRDDEARPRPSRPRLDCIALHRWVGGDNTNHHELHVWMGRDACMHVGHGSHQACWRACMYAAMVPCRVPHVFAVAVSLHCSVSHCTAGYCDDDVASCWCPPDTKYGHKPAPPGSPPGTPPISWGRPMNDHCRPGFVSAGARPAARVHHGSMGPWVRGCAQPVRPWRACMCADIPPPPATPREGQTRPADRPSPDAA